MSLPWLLAVLPTAPFQDWVTCFLPCRECFELMAHCQREPPGLRAEPSPPWGDSHIQLLVAGRGRGGVGYEGQIILFQGVTTLKSPPCPNPSSRAFCGISWGLGCVYTVEQLFPLLGSLPLPPTDIDPTGTPDRLPAHKSYFRISFPQTRPKNAPLTPNLFWLSSTYLSSRQAVLVFLLRL